MPVNCLRRILFRSKRAIIWWSIRRNEKNRTELPPGSEIVFKKEAATPAQAADKAGYVERMYDDYRAHLPELRGKRVLELGPGDNFGVSWLMLARGAEAVVALDKYRAQTDPSFQHMLYAEIEKRLEGPEAERFAELVQGGAGFDAITDCPVEEAGQRLPAVSFDCIVSRSVLEYLKDPAGALEVMHGLLKPGGVMVHLVDVRDDGLFSAHGHHPLTFLTLPDATYARMTSHSYRPNRWLRPMFRERLEALGFRVELPVSQELDVTPPRGLVPPWDGMAEADLRAAGFTIIAHKPE